MIENLDIGKGRLTIKKSKESLFIEMFRENKKNSLSKI